MTLYKLSLKDTPLFLEMKMYSIQENKKETRISVTIMAKSQSSLLFSVVSVVSERRVLSVEL